MNKTKAVLLAVGLVLAMVPAFAQPAILINGGVGYIRAELDGMEEYPFGGISFYAGTYGLIPLTDFAKFKVGAGINYYSASAKDEYDVEITISAFSLALSPSLRLSQEEKTYADISLDISIPLSSKATVKVPGYGTQNLDVDDTDTDLAIGLFGRYNFIGVGIGKVLTGSDAFTTFGATVFIPLSEQFEISPSISYATGKNGTQLNIFIGFECTL